MKCLVVYESQFGNTRHVAEIVSRRLEAYGEATLVPFTGYSTTLLGGVDLVLVGAPTQAHGVTAEMRKFLGDLQPVDGLQAATFDTRVKGPRFLWGSAAREIAVHLERKGFRIVAPPESFLVTLSKEPALYAGEDQHATDWAVAVATLVGEAATASV